MAKNDAISAAMLDALAQIAQDGWRIEHVGDQPVMTDGQRRISLRGSTLRALWDRHCLQSGPRPDVYHISPKGREAAAEYARREAAFAQAAAEAAAVTGLPPAEQAARGFMPSDGTLCPNCGGAKCHACGGLGTRSGFDQYTTMRGNGKE